MRWDNGPGVGHDGDPGRRRATRRVPYDNSAGALNVPHRQHTQINTRGRPSDLILPSQPPHVNDGGAAAQETMTDG